MMSSEKIYLTAEEQNFLMEMFEMDNPTVAFEKFISILTEERAKVEECKEYLATLMSRAKVRGIKW
jgi:hypothetical protein